MNLLIVEEDKSSARQLYAMAAGTNLFSQIRILNRDEALSEVILQDQTHVVVLSIACLTEDVSARMQLLTTMHSDTLFYISGTPKQYPEILSAISAGANGFLFRPYHEAAVASAMQSAVSLNIFRHMNNDQQASFFTEAERVELYRIKAEKILFSMITTDNDLRALYQDLCSFAPQYRSYKKVAVGIVSAEHLQLDSGNASNPRSSSSVARMLNNKMIQNDYGIAISGLKSSGEIFLLFFNNLDNIELFCRNIYTEIFSLTGLKLTVGLGVVMPFPESIQESALVARKNSQAFNLLAPIPPMVTSNTRDPRFFTLPYNFDRMEKDLYAALLTGQHAIIRNAAAQFCTEIIEPGYLCIRQLERVRLIYHGMRTNWIESFRNQYPHGSSGVASPEFVFRLPYDRSGEFSPELLKESLLEDLKLVSNFILALSSPERLDKNFVQAVHEYVVHNYTGSVTLKNLAEMFNVTPNYLSYAYKKKYGVTLINHIRKLRHERALDLLENTDMSIELVSHNVGYPDPKYFSRVFRQIESVSPSDYRLHRV